MPIDILRTKIIRCLRPRLRGYWDFETCRETTSLIELELWQQDLGKLGTLTIEKNDAHHSEIHVSLPPFPTERRWTDEEKSAIGLPKPERYAAIAIVQARIKNEADGLYQKRLDILEAAIEKCFTCLNREEIWPAATAQAGGDGAAAVSVPTRPEDFRKWQAVWRLIRRRVELGDALVKICGWLKKAHPDLPAGRTTVSKIIKAGLAGKLEQDMA